MPADLVPHAAIPNLAAQVSPEMLEVLRRVQKAEFITNGDGIDSKDSGGVGPFVGTWLSRSQLHW